MQKPIPHYNLLAIQARKGLSLAEVSRRAGVPYNRCSEILNGHRIDPVSLNKITTVLNRAPLPALPKGVAA